MRSFRALLATVLAALAFAAPASAHHPGTNLDEVMGDKEKYFQAIDKPAPSFELADAEGRRVRLSDFADKIVVLHFIYASCPDVCPLHAEKIAEIQTLIKDTPMKGMVQFVTITTDPANDTAEVMKGYGPAHGLDSSNWIFLTKQAGQPEDVTRKLAGEYGLKFVKTEDGLQMHGMVTHIIDRGGRLAAKFHGLRFEPVNMVLYINGLTNAQAPKRDRSLWERMKDWF
ncbi:SCO family protein [Taklimakanibacter lacteus]|uniref:SCO family protein n=1 Tax=Taklimakanibacter lacteus TaxID=2268456 RepID=UPI000E662D25